MYIRKINKSFMKENVGQFINIIYEYDGEYWNKENLLVDLEQKWDYSFCTIHNEKVIGFIICSKKSDFIHIHKFMVSKKYHNDGVGTSMLNTLSYKCLLNEIKYIQLKVRKDNINAINFYKNYGFLELNSEDDLLVKVVQTKALIENILKSKVKLIDTISTSA